MQRVSVKNGLAILKQYLSKIKTKTLQENKKEGIIFLKWQLIMKT